jgi:hypothetical protein
MKPRVYVDGFLLEWSERFFDPAKFWGPLRTMGRARGSGTALQYSVKAGARAPQRQPPAGGAAAVRERLQSLTRKSPQVMVKVYRGGKGMKAIREHMRYIARVGKDGELEIEDQEGLRAKGAAEIRKLADDWQYGQVALEEHSERRETLNIVLSMPAGTDPVLLKKAVRDFAEREFAGRHQYVMALHTADTPHYDEDSTDPPNLNPHVHLLVKVADSAGRRLNPRKADLHRWREGFAEALRAYGVEAVATSRAERLRRERGVSHATRSMADRGKSFSSPRPRPVRARSRASTTRQERAAKAQTTEREILRRYREVAAVLMDSEDAADRVLARELADRFGFDRPPSAPDRTEGQGTGRRRTGTDHFER